MEMALHRNNESGRAGDNRQDVEKTLARVHREASRGLYYVNHMLTKRKLLLHELDDAAKILEKAASDLGELRSTYYGTDGRRVRPSSR
jgi:hypothetical protein